MQLKKANSTRQKGMELPVSRLSMLLPKNGARIRNRTEDLILTKDALYQLSYVGPENVFAIPPTTIPVVEAMDFRHVPYCSSLSQVCKFPQAFFSVFLGLQAPFSISAKPHGRSWPDIQCDAGACRPWKGLYISDIAKTSAPFPSFRQCSGFKIRQFCISCHWRRCRYCCICSAGNCLRVPDRFERL